MNSWLVVNSLSKARLTKKKVSMNQLYYCIPLLSALSNKG